ncbi:MAG: TolC family protein [Gemmatimonadales bacterium]|nr:TolC family protein [Gemmatimonadales bacterium]
MRFIVLMLASLASGAAAQEPRRVTLDEALRLASRSQPAMVQARQDVRVASAQERQSFGAFLPSLNANLSTSKSGQRVDATSGQVTRAPLAFNDQYGISGSLDLFTGFRRGANRRAAGATTSLREATQLRQEYAVALSTKQAFFNALAAAELVAVAETRLRRADEQLKLTAEKLRLGATTRSDSLRGRVEYGNAQLQLIQARADLRFTQATLGRAIGVEGSVAPVPDSALEARLGTLDTAALRHEASANAPSVREAEASVLSARASLGANRAAYFPTLTASGNSNWARADSNFLGGEQFGRTWSLRLQVSYPIFNGFTRETNIITADANATAAEARLRDARLLLDASLTQVFASLDAAAAKTDIARVSVAAAEEDLRMQRERYRLGSSTIFEVLTSQVSLDQAQVDLVRSRYDYLVARAQIEALVGHSL